MFLVRKLCIQSLCIGALGFLCLGHEPSIAQSFSLASDTAPEPAPEPLLDTLHLQNYFLKQNIQLGIDHWAGNFNNPRTVGLLDLTSSGTYSDLIPWFKFSGAYTIVSNQIQFNLDYRYSKTLGGNLDQANLDFAITPTIGFRVGVLPMRLNFCQVYEQNNPWIMEISTSCKYASQSIYRATNSAPGAQLYLNSQTENWFSSYQLGFYQPALWGYDKTEFGYEPIAPTSGPLPPPYTYSQTAQQTTSNNKISVGFNGLHPATGIEIKAGVLWAVATTTQPGSLRGIYGDGFEYSSGSASPNSSNVNRYHIIFAGINFPLTNQLSVLPTYNLYLGNVTGNTNAYYQFAPPYQDIYDQYQFDNGSGAMRVQNLGLEFKYGLAHNDVLAAYIGIANVELNNIVTNQLSNLNKSVASLSYRKDFESGIFGIVQGVYGRIIDNINNVPATNAGGYVGFRLGYLLH